MPKYQIDASRYNLDDSRSETWALVDHWGREVGVKIVTFLVAYEIVPSSTDWGHTEEDAALRHAEKINKGTFGLELQPLRNGLKYQSGNTKFFVTADAREAYITKYRKDAFKRAAKTVERQKAQRA